MTKKHLIIIGFGEVHLQKYLNPIRDSLTLGNLTSFSIIDLKSAQEDVSERMKRGDCQDVRLDLLEDEMFTSPIDSTNRITNLILSIKQSLGSEVKAFISTEARFHEIYLRVFFKLGIDTLVEKPVITPTNNGRYAPERIPEIMEQLESASNENGGRNSVMCFSRYHTLYNENLLRTICQKSEHYSAPVTSLHLHTNSGVWNLHNEFEEREDHPYKYGYGMLMHGAYHYIDIAAQVLAMNRNLLPNDELTFRASSYSAHPYDQMIRIPSSISSQFNDQNHDWKSQNSNRYSFGETDVCSSFCLWNETQQRALTIGTLSFEQTTPSIRAWKDLPSNFYNKNGRVASTDVEIQLSTLFSAHSRSYKVPKIREGKVVSVVNHGEITSRSNGALFPNEECNTKQEFSGFTNTDSNLRLLKQWISGEETKSSFQSHKFTMSILKCLSCSIQNQGASHSVEVPLDLHLSNDLNS